MKTKVAGMTKTVEWSIENAMHNVMRHKDCNQPTFIKPTHLKNNEVNQATLKRCLNYVACLISQHGDLYLPIFERLKNELEQHQKQDALKDYAKQIANKEIDL